MKKRNSEISLKSIVDIFLPKLWIIVLVSVAIAAVMGVSAMTKNDTYTSTGKYMVQKFNYSNEDLHTGLNTGEITAMQAMIANAKEIINTNDFANEVIAVLHALKNSSDEAIVSKYNIEGVDWSQINFENMSAADIKSCMSVQPCGGDTTCYYLSVTLADPALSRVLADVVGKLLVDKYAETKYAIVINRIDTPTMPTAPNSKGTVKNAAIGFLIGMLATMFIIFVFSSFDVIVRSRERLEEKFDIPIIGVIPRLESDN
jgi:capsular polysaccharide biosynthesis protein